MKRRLGAIVTLLLLVMVAATQGTHLYTRPALPPEEMLERLNLTLAWHTRVSMNGLRDGLRTLQLAPGKSGFQFIAQTRHGAVAALDAETGDLQWQTQVGVPYWPAQPVAYNSRALLVTRREYLYALDRATGQHLIQTADSRGKQPKPGMLLRSVPSSAPVADEHMLFVPFGSRIAALMLPFERKQGPDVHEEFARSAGENEPYEKWVNTLLGLRTEQPLLVAGAALGAVSPNGTFFSLGSMVPTEPTFFKTGEPVATAPGQYENFAYVASEYGTLFAINMANNDQAWRFTADAPILRPPHVTARDVYVSPDRLGLYRLDRPTGIVRWLNRDAVRFLATNGQFVYATDGVGRLLVLDYFRGTTLAVYDLRDYPVVYSNELTDRVYLGSNDGLIICLRHRGQRTPLLNKLPPPPPPAKQKAKELKPEAPKDNGNQKAEPGARLESPTLRYPERMVCSNAHVYPEAVVSRRTGQHDTSPSGRGCRAGLVGRRAAGGTIS